jgi:Zn-finger nucleic acid-binding protein
MNAVTARANPGTLIQLDQCGKCGGLWCDKWELFPIDPDEAERVEDIDTALLAAPVKLPQRALHCPRCTAPLQECKDPALPAELLFERCLRCEGIWLNRGELISYKAHQRKIQLKKSGVEAIIQKIPEVYRDPKSWVVKGTQGMMAYPRMVGDAGQDLKPTVAGAVGAILQALLRAALGI